MRKSVLSCLGALLLASGAHAAVSGLVVDDASAPVGGAWVQIIEGEKLLPPIKADSVGRFHFGTSAGEILLRASAPGYHAAYLSWKAGEEPTLLLKRAETLQIPIRVVDENGQPRPGVRVICEEDMDRAQVPRPLDGTKFAFRRLSIPANPLKPHPPVTTAADGTAKLSINRYPGARLRLLYDRRLGWVERTVRPETAETIVLNVGSAADVQGSVITPSGCALHEGSATSWVRKNGSVPMSRTLQLRADGSFDSSREYMNPFREAADGPVQLAGPAPFDPGPVEAGDYQVIIGLSSLKTLQRDVALKAGENQIQINIPDIGRLALDVPEGVNPQGAEIRTNGISTSVKPQQANAREIDLGCMEAGAKTLLFWSQDAGWDRQRVKVDPALTTRVKLSLRPGGTIRGLWEEAGFIPYSIIARNEAVSFSVRPDERGSFVFGNLPPGEWEVRGALGKTGKQSEMVRVSLVEGQTRTIKLGYLQDQAVPRSPVAAD